MSATSFQKAMHDRGFNMCDDGHTFQCAESVLHMPIKLSRVVADNLNRMGRTTVDGQPFDPMTLYIPPALEASVDLVRFVHHTMSLEHAIDPERLVNSLLLVSLRVGELAPGERLGMGGWHVDGHQGAERIQPNGSKVPTDRAYFISNALGTLYTPHRLDLDPVRALAARHGLTLDQFNLQDIIQKSMETHTPEIREALPNTLYYLNPYMLHQSQANPGPKSVRRSFLRLLYSVDERDRVGDTINPVTGPCFSFKIKTITDIVQLPADAFRLCVRSEGEPLDASAVARHVALLQDDPGLDPAANALRIYNTRKHIKRELLTWSRDALETLAKDRTLTPLYSSLIGSVLVQLHNAATLAKSPPTQHTTDTINLFLRDEYARFTHPADTSDMLRVVSGDATDVSIVSETVPSLNPKEPLVTRRVVRYGDHVTRMQALAQHRPEIQHRFTVSDGIAARLDTYKPNCSWLTPLKFLTTELDPIVTSSLLPFCYDRLEDITAGWMPIAVPMPPDL